MGGCYVKLALCLCMHVHVRTLVCTHVNLHAYKMFMHACDLYILCVF